MQAPRSIDHRREWLVQFSWAVTDALVVASAAYASTWLRFAVDVNKFAAESTARFAIAGAIVHVVCGVLAGPYRIGHLRGSFEETANLGRSVVLDAAILILLLLMTPWFNHVPRTMPLLVPMLGLVGMFTLRFVIRSYRWIDLSGRHDVEIVYTGLRPSKKLSERLLAPSEDVRKSSHPLVDYVSVPALSTSAVLSADPLDGNDARFRMCDEATVAIQMQEN